MRSVWEYRELFQIQFVTEQVGVEASQSRCLQVDFDYSTCRLGVKPTKPWTILPPLSFFSEWTAFIQHFTNQWPLKALCNIASHSHTDSMQGNSQLIRSSQVEGSCSGTPRQIGGAGDRTTNLPVTSLLALPPELHATHDQRNDGMMEK